MRIAAQVAANKHEHPELYCRSHGCLWRVNVRGMATPCPRHPVVVLQPAAPTDTEILERLIAIGEVGPVRFYHGSGWSYNATIYPDARSALAVFTERTAAKASA